LTEPPELDVLVAPGARKLEFVSSEVFGLAPQLTSEPLTAFGELLELVEQLLLVLLTLVEELGVRTVEELLLQLYAA